MTHLAWWAYPAMFLATLVLALGLTPGALRVALRFHLLDRPGPIKAQASPVPYLGGAAMVLAFATRIVAAALYDPPVAGLASLLVLVATAVALSLMGLVDDLRGPSIWVRLACEAAAGLVVWSLGISPHLDWRPLGAPR
ncbi:MAG: hypothetical protein ACYDH5_14705 [Acidimicrobiales bacterium]